MAGKGVVHHAFELLRIKEYFWLAGRTSHLRALGIISGGAVSYSVSGWSRTG